jgi:hypothetical protein
MSIIVPRMMRMISPLMVQLRPDRRRRGLGEAARLDLVDRLEAAVVRPGI